MSHLGITACSLSVVLAAVAGQAPCASAVLIEKELVSSTNLNQLDVFGLTHTAVGNAQLSMSPTGTLVISNIGSSGLDGVTVPIGDVRGNSMSMDLGDMGALSAGGLVEVFYPYAFGDQTIFVQAQPDGSARLGTGVCGGPEGAQAVCVSVEILNNGVVVGAREFVCGETDHFISGDLGTDPITGEAMSFRFEQVGADYVHTVSLPASTALTLTGSITQTGDITETGDSVRITLGGLPPAETLSGPVRVLASNLGGDLEITGEQLILPLTQAREGELPTWIWYPIGAGVVATGSSSIIGTPRTDVCDSYPFMWLQDGNLLSPLSGVTVSNIGSSGLDGVVIDFAGDSDCGPGFFMCPDGSCVADPADCGTEVVGRSVHFGGNDMVSPDYLDLGTDSHPLIIGLRSITGGGTGSGLGSIQFVHEPGTINEVTLHTDFTPIGATLVRVEVYQDGVFVGEFEEFEREDTLMASIAHPVTGMDITGCGSLGGDILDPPCIFFTTQNPVTVTGTGGVAMVGNEVRVLAVDVATPIETVGALSITGTNLEDFDLRLDTASDHAEFENALGRRHMAEGNATLSTNADGHLIVSNIGSSGLDGYTTGPWDTEIISMQLKAGGDFPPDSFFDIALAAWWPDCDDDGFCSPMNVRMQSTSSDQVTLTATHADPTLPMQVTLFSPDGTPLRSFPMTQAESLQISDPVGVGLEVELMDFGLSRGPGGGFVQCMTTHLISNPGGGGGGGSVLVMSPDGVATPDVDSIEVCVTTPGPPLAQRVDHRGHVTVLKGPVGGGGGAAQSDMEIELVALNAFDIPTSSLGAARFWWNAKKSGESLGQAAHGIDDDCDRLTISNIGSSGEDGVSMSISGEVCNGRDDDCDGWVDEMWIGLRDMGGTTGPIKHTFVRLETTKSPGEIGQGGGGAVIYKSIISGPAGDEIGVSMEDELAIPVEYLVRVEVYDGLDRLLAFEDENSYPPVLGSHPNILSFFGNAHSGKHKKKVKITRPVDASTPLLISGSTGGDLPGPLPAILARSGQVAQGALSYEITLFPTGDVPFVEMVALDLRFTSDVGTTGSVDIMDAGVGRFSPPCVADMNGDGFLDNGDINAFIAAFLSGNSSADFNGDGFLDNGDINAFIAAFLAGC